MDQQSPVVSIELPLTELNVIMTALSERPFREVAQIFNRINGQVQPQLAAAQAPAPVQAPAPTPVRAAPAATKPAPVLPPRGAAEDPREMVL